MNDLAFLALAAMAGMTFLLAFWIARLCLAVVIRALDRSSGRRPAESEPSPPTLDGVQPLSTAALTSARSINS